MSVIQSFWLGVLQGLTEFLPVSSSGHLLVLPALLHWREPSVALLLLAHLGTLLAVLLCFRKEILALFFTGRHGFEQLGFLVLGTIPAGAVGLALEKRVEAIFQSLTLLPLFFLSTAFLLFLLDRTERRSEKLSRRKAFFVGLWQALALFPGISRMGTTLFGSIRSGLSMEESLKFSFLLSVPTILGGALLEARHIVSLPPLSSATIFFSSFVAGLFSILLLKKMAHSKKLSLFSGYLILLSLFLLLR